MSGKSVLITGANGHLGFRTLIAALESGYKVRAAVRRAEAAEQIKSAKSTQPYLSQLEIVFINDLLKEGAFDDAVVGMDFILHLASPISKPSQNYYADFVEPAVQGTLSILRSAAKAPSVKRIVITSSIGVLDIGRDGKLKATDLAPVPDAHEQFPNPFLGYTGSKKIALNETAEFIRRTNPHFDIVTILPAVILGKNELVTSTAGFSIGTNRYPMSIALGTNTPNPMIGATVDVSDVAKIHVEALDAKVEGNRSYIASGGGVKWSDVSGILKKLFPEKVQDGVLVLGGEMATREVNLDTTDTERVFGIQWRGFEEQLRSVVGHYLEVQAEESG